MRWPAATASSDCSRSARGGTDGVDDAYEAAAEHFATDELAALLYAIVTINGWNRLAVTTHFVFEA